MLHWATDFLSRKEMRTKIRSNKSMGVEVTSGVPQGSVLAPIMFSIYVNDMADGVTSYMTMFSDDAKIMSRVINEADCSARPRSCKNI